MIISKYARTKAAQGSGFIVVPQNGLELAFNNLDEDKGLCAPFMAAIDGFGVEELFYDGKKKIDKYRLGMCHISLRTHHGITLPSTCYKYVHAFLIHLNSGLCRKIRATHSIMVADFVSKLSDEPDAIQNSVTEGFLCFPRRANNYDYNEIPQDPINVNNGRIVQTRTQ